MIDHLFKGSKIRWLPVYKRVHVRLDAIPRVKLAPGARFTSLTSLTPRVRSFGTVHVKTDGIEIRLNSRRGLNTRSVMIRSAQDMNPDVIDLIRSAEAQARIAIPRSIAPVAPPTALHT